jgi:hypothetical protein
MKQLKDEKCIAELLCADAASFNLGIELFKAGKYDAKAVAWHTSKLCIVEVQGEKEYTTTQERGLFRNSRIITTQLQSKRIVFKIYFWGKDNVVYLYDSHAYRYNYNNPTETYTLCEVTRPANISFEERNSLISHRSADFTVKWDDLEYNKQQIEKLAGLTQFKKTVENNCYEFFKMYLKSLK